MGFNQSCVFWSALLGSVLKCMLGRGVRKREQERDKGIEEKRERMRKAYCMRAQRWETTVSPRVLRRELLIV